MLDLSECIRVLVALALSIGADLNDINSICNSNPTCQRELAQWELNRSAAVAQRQANRERDITWLERDHDNDQQTLQSLAADTIESSEVNQCRLTSH